MDIRKLEIAIEETQHLLLKLTEAKTLRWHQMPDKAAKVEKQAFISLDYVAEALGYEIASKEVALARHDEMVALRAGNLPL